MAVGDYEASGSTFDDYTQTWNGGSWTIQPTPNPSNSNLSGVSCSAASACTAVGDVLSSGVLVTLAQRWNGASWAIQATPNRADAKDSYLAAVDCNSATSCTAVGSVFHGGTNPLVTLAERWDGTRWHLSAPGGVTGARQSDLTGVSCPATNNCMGVGWYDDSSSNEFPLFAPYN